MRVQILNEDGYFTALLGLSLSFNRPVENMISVAEGLYNKNNGHNKFLRFISVWLDMNMTREFWQQFDTYTVGVVRQSESTMHTLLRKPLTAKNFKEGAEVPQAHIDYINQAIAEKNLQKAKDNLPESFLQRRIVWCNYQSLRTMMAQRYSHKMSDWNFFCVAILEQIEHPEFFRDLEDRVYGRFN